MAGNVLGFSLRYYVRGNESPLALREMSLAYERAGLDMAEYGKRLFPRLIPILEEEVKGQFAAQGRGPNRGKWEPLSYEYRKQKAKLYPGKPILRRTDKMFKGLVESASRFAQRAYSASVMHYGTSGVKYASFHQTGTDEGLASASRTKFTNMPDRPPLDFTNGFVGKVQKASLDTVREVVRASRLDRFAKVKDGGAP